MKRTLIFGVLYLICIFAVFGQAREVIDTTLTLKKLEQRQSTILQEKKIVKRNNSGKLEYSTFTDSRDGKIYQTVKIGSQWIMTENLAYKPNKGKYKPFNGKDKNFEIHGYQYNWETANSVAPEGWHLPSINEWKKMKLYLSGSIEDIRKNLSIDDCIGLDRIKSNAIIFFGREAGHGYVYYCWSSTPYRNFCIWLNGDYVSYERSKNSFYSVRLFKDLTDYDLWDWTKTIGSVVGYKKFLNSYPNSIYADSAAFICAQMIKDRTENCKRFRAGMAPKEIVTLLGFEDKVNEEAFGGLFIGLGLLSKTKNYKSSYNGIAVFDGYAFTFQKGELTEWNIIENEINTESFHGETNDDIFNTITRWSVDGVGYNLETKTK
jgi:uncharacterized protein (TIGR02145 family)